jgi:hypothetical protein
MKRSIILVFILTLVVLQSCLVKSLHPFFKDSDVVFKKELINNWTDQEGARWEILPVKESKVAYELRHYKTGKKQPDEAFVGHLFKLNDQLFLDFFPLGKDESDGTMMFDMHMMPTHTIARVEGISENEIEIRWLNEKWLQSLFSQNKIKISHEVVRDPIVPDNSDMSYILTASTEEMQKFIIKYGDEDKAFIDDNSVWLKLTR